MARKIIGSLTDCEFMNSLLPERSLSFSPSLAATIGLEEAILLQGLQEIAFHCPNATGGPQKWSQASEQVLTNLFPFWDAQGIARLAKSLVEKGILQLSSGPYDQVRHLYYTLDQPCSPAKAPINKPAQQAPATRPQAAAPAQAQQTPVTAASNPDSRSGSATTITANWQPDASLFAQTRQQGIDDEFVNAQLPEFVSYWLQRRATNYAWGSAFLKHVIREWRYKEARESKQGEISRQWRPSEDAMEILLRIDINKEFIEDATAEFVLYWRERGDSTSTWNSKFITHVKRQWARYNATLGYDTEPRQIANNWQPSQDVYDILKMGNIDLEFARRQLAEFVLFWRDSKQLHASWNTKFLQHVKYQWARQHQLAGQQNARQQTTSGNGQQSGQSTFERLTDRSWASGL